MKGFARIDQLDDGSFRVLSRSCSQRRLGRPEFGLGLRFTFSIINEGSETYCPHLGIQAQVFFHGIW